jgi:hypothetical protein
VAGEPVFQDSLQVGLAETGEAGPPGALVAIRNRVAEYLGPVGGKPHPVGVLRRNAVDDLVHDVTQAGDLQQPHALPADPDRTGKRIRCRLLVEQGDSMTLIGQHQRAQLPD